MLYHGFKSINDHTVIPGIIEEIELEDNIYYVSYNKVIKSKPAGCDFDDIGNTAIVNLYYYNQKSK